MPSNLPPGVTESMLPGNTPDDVLWESLVEGISNVDVICICNDNNAHCSFAVRGRDFIRCEKMIITDKGRAAGPKIDDAIGCPHVWAEIERRFDEHKMDLSPLDD